MDNDRSCAKLFKQINDELQKRANNDMRAQDITMSQAQVLLELSKAPGMQLSMKELEKRLHVAQPTAVGLINRLERKALAESFCDPRDKRAKFVKITRDGLDLAAQTKQIMAQGEKNMLSMLTETEQEILWSLLKKVRDSLK